MARLKILFVDHEALLGGAELSMVNLISALKKITLHFEGYNTNSTTIYDNLPEDYTHRLMKAIVAFEIEIKEMRNVFKLSQNRDPKSYDNIIAKLKEGDSDAQFIAKEMERRAKELFPEGVEWDGSKYFG